MQFNLFILSLFLAAPLFASNEKTSNDVFIERALEKYKEQLRIDGEKLIAKRKLEEMHLDEEMEEKVEERKDDLRSLPTEIRDQVLSQMASQFVNNLWLLKAHSNHPAVYRTAGDQVDREQVLRELVETISITTEFDRYNLAPVDELYPSLKKTRKGLLLGQLSLTAFTIFCYLNWHWDGLDAVHPKAYFVFKLAIFTTLVVNSVIGLSWGKNNIPRIKNHEQDLENYNAKNETLKKEAKSWSKFWDEVAARGITLPENTLLLGSEARKLAIAAYEEGLLRFTSRIQTEMVQNQKCDNTLSQGTEQADQEAEMELKSIEESDIRVEQNLAKLKK